MKNTFILILSFLMFSGALKAQQTFQLSQYQNNLFLFNPAVTGKDNNTQINLGYRKQWAGFGNEPITFFIGGQTGLNVQRELKQPLALRTSHNESYHIEENEKETTSIKHGLGGFIMNDKYGAFSNLNLNLSYALHYNFKKNLNVSAGANLGFSTFQFDQSEAIPENANETTYLNFISEREKLSTLNFNLGAMVYGDNYYIGYGSYQLLTNKVALQSLSSEQLILHNYIMAGYTFKINSDFKLSPNLMINTVKSAPVSYTTGLKGLYKEKYTFGLGYRKEDAVIIQLGYQMDCKLYFGYSYDLNSSTLKSSSSGGHEIILKFTIK